MTNTNHDPLSVRTQVLWGAILFVLAALMAWLNHPQPAPMPPKPHITITVRPDDPGDPEPGTCRQWHDLFRNRCDASRAEI